MQLERTMNHSTAFPGNRSATSALSAESGPLFTQAESTLQAIALLLIIVVIVLGNIMILYIIYRDRNMRTPQYLLITSLACSDLGVGMATAPLTMVSAFNRGEWILGDIACQYQGIANSTFYIATMFTLMAMTMEKYFSIVRPLSRFITPQRTCKFIVIAWLLALVISMLPLVGFGRYDENKTTQSCGIAFPRNASERMFLILTLFSGSIMPLAVMIVANAVIFVAVRRHSKRLRRHARGQAAKDGIFASQKHFTITIVIILAVFIGSWTPFFCLAITAEMTESADRIPPFLGVLAYWCGYAASAWNPVIYISRNRRFRRGAIRVKNALTCKQQDSTSVNMSGAAWASDVDGKRLSFVVS